MGKFSPAGPKCFLIFSSHSEKGHATALYLGSTPPLEGMFRK